MNIQTITAATQGSQYVACLPHHKGIAVIIPEAKNWHEGTKIKPQVILNHLEQADALLWIDADCAVDLPSEPPEGLWDVGIFDNIVPTHKNRISAAFILFRNSQGAQYFLRRWKHNNSLAAKDHPALTKTINQCKNTVRIQNLSQWLKGRCVVNAYLGHRGRIEG